MKSFEEELASLNDEQKKAVNTIDGPVLVIAGPGTGKTQLLSMRVANILKSTDTNPSNILCLTFTNKAAINMKNRIIALTGQEGSRVAVKTFHSFAAEIMNIYPDYFWNAAKLSVAPESVQLDIIESIVSKLPLDNPLALRFAGQYTLLNDIQRSINLAKDAGLTPDKLKAIINFNIAYIDSVENQMIEICSQRLSAKNLEGIAEKVASLKEQEVDQTLRPLTSLPTVIIDSLNHAIELDSDSGKASNTSRWKSRWVQTITGKRGMLDERKRNAWWLELAEVYDKYREAIHERGFYDYADMLVEVVSQLEQNPEMLANIQERFNYVLIDEFQDTNPAQLRLAHLITDHHSTSGNPNLMAVGDDDQSIFKFNGAELNNMLGFKSSYPDSRVVVLTKNYRSTQDVLNTAKKIIEQAETRLINSDKSLNKNLRAESPPKQGEITAMSYSSRELQLSEVARQIKKAHEPDKSIAVLARSHDSLLRMCALLQELDVPVRYEQASNILDHEIIKQAELLINLLIAIQDGNKSATNALIHQIVRWEAWGINSKELWSLAVDNYQNANWLDSMTTNENETINNLGAWFTNLAVDSANQPVSITIEQIIGLRPTQDFISPIRDFFLNNNSKNANKYFHALSAIQLLRALTHEFAQNDEPTLEEFARFININKTNNKVIADESPFITGDHSVQLLTIHKAKGLEFDHVFVIDAIEDNWKPKAGRRKPPANLPLQPVGDDFDDYVRLMYVALTRAKSSITISSYYQDHAGKDVATSSIIQGAVNTSSVSTNDRQKLITTLEENMRWPELPGGKEKEILKARLENYNLSVTDLQNFLDLTRGGPQYFKERNLLRLPEAKTASLSYGTAIHEALEQAQKLTNQDRFRLETVQDIFSKSLLDEQMNASEYVRFNAEGRQTLLRLFKDFSYELPKGSLAEQKMRDVKVGQASISGKLDRVDISDNTLKIVDYKTGAPVGSFYTKDKNKAIKTHKHKTQLVFYALLTNQYPSYSKYENVVGQMVYVSADDQKNLSISYAPTKDDISYLRNLIDAVWTKIVSLDLPDVSAYPKDIDGILKFEEDLIAGK